MRAHLALLALCLVALAPRMGSAMEQKTGSLLLMYRVYSDPLAVCNDGSPGALRTRRSFAAGPRPSLRRLTLPPRSFSAGFYFSPANDTEKSNLWLIYLEGGQARPSSQRSAYFVTHRSTPCYAAQWCYDQGSCAERAVMQPYLTSSRPWYKHLRMGGIFDSDPHRSPWAGANLVYIAYCSSDAWVGDVGPESNSWGWSFRGQRIIAAVMAKLTAGVEVTTTDTVHFPNRTHEKVTTTTNYSLGAAPKVLFGGCSAGGRGAMFSLDYIQPMLPPGAPPVLGFFDSPMWVDVEPFIPGTEPLENETMAVYNLVNATARIPVACAAAYPGEEGWKCLYGQYRVPYVQTPYLMSASQFDKYQLPYNEGSMPPWNASEMAYAAAFQTAVRDVVLNVPTKAQPRSAVYSSACFKHCTSSLAWGSFWGVRVDDVSLKDYLGTWYFGTTDPELQNDETGHVGEMPTGISPQRIEACIGFGCGQCHKSTAAPAPPLPPTYKMSLEPRKSHTHSSTQRAKGAAWPHVLLLLALCAAGVASLQVARKRMEGPTRSRGHGGGLMEVAMSEAGEDSPLVRAPPLARPRSYFADKGPGSLGSVAERA